MSDPSDLDATTRNPPPNVDPDASTEAAGPPHQFWTKATGEIPPGQPDGYDLIRPLGRGTFGEVWQARQHGSGLTVAVKFFALSTDWRGVYSEIQSLAATDGTPGLIQLLDAEPESSPPFLVMSYAEGGSLAERLKPGPMPLKEALTLFRRITAAMAFLHAKGIRHCDLKPGNILLDAHGNPLIADLGQAKLPGDANPSTGTFFFMAPEQAFIAPSEEQLRQIERERQHSTATNVLDGAQGRPDTRWDVYALGAIFYHMLIGRPPHEEGTLHEELRGTENFHRRLARYRAAICRAPKPIAHHHVHGMDRKLAGIIDDCLQVNPRLRTHDAGNLKDILKEHSLWRRRRPVFWWGVAASFFVVAILLGFFFFKARDILADSRQAMTVQMERDDIAKARLIANGLERILEERIDRVETYAASPHLRDLVDQLQHEMSDAKVASPPESLATGEGEKIRKQIDTWLLEHFEQHGGYREYSTGMTVSVLVYDDNSDKARCYHVSRVKPASVRQGKIDPWEENTFWTRNWSWRDYVNGQGDKPPDNLARVPISRTHISEPYDSFTPHIGMLSTIATPVFAPDDHTRPIGLVITSIELNRFYRWMDQPFESPDHDTGPRDCFPTIADNRGYCFMHEGVAPADLDDARYDAVLEDVLSDSNGDGIIPDYKDPLDPGVKYIASLAWFNPYVEGEVPGRTSQSWVILVQHRVSAIDRPIEGIRLGLSRAGGALVIVLAILVGALWTWLGRLSRSVRSSEDV